MLLNSSGCVVLVRSANISLMSVVSVALVLLASSIISQTRARLVLHAMRLAFSEKTRSLTLSLFRTKL